MTLVLHMGIKACMYGKAQGDAVALLHSCCWLPDNSVSMNSLLSCSNAILPTVIRSHVNMSHLGGEEGGGERGVPVHCCHHKQQLQVQLLHDRRADARRAPLIKSVLLYGAPKTGKTSLCQSVAHTAGANFFDLSPRNTDAKYPGKAAALMIHMVRNPAVMISNIASIHSNNIAALPKYQHRHVMEADCYNLHMIQKLSR